MKDPVLRQWALLQAIPRYPRKADPQTLRARLESAGYEVSLRTVQRDLEKLSKHFALGSDERTIPWGWYWDPDSPVLDLPAMDANLALVLRLVELHAPGILPQQLATHLKPHFLKAAQVLSADRGGPLGHWLERLRVIPNGMPLQPPKPLNAEAVSAVYDAVLRRRRFEARYQSRNASPDSTPARYDVNPIALVVRGPLVYLVCTLWSYTDLRHLALHRFEHAALSDVEATTPEGFDLDAYLQGGAFEIPFGRPLSLRLQVERSIADHLDEQPLSDDQTVIQGENGRPIVQATVADSGQLRWWLMGFGDLVEVLEPESLRTELAHSLDLAARRYRRPPTSSGAPA